MILTDARRGWRERQKRRVLVVAAHFDTFTHDQIRDASGVSWGLIYEAVKEWRAEGLCVVTNPGHKPYLFRWED